MCGGRAGQSACGHGARAPTPSRGSSLCGLPCSEPPEWHIRLHLQDPGGMACPCHANGGLETVAPSADTDL